MQGRVARRSVHPRREPLQAAHFEKRTPLKAPVDEDYTISSSTHQSSCMDIQAACHSQVRANPAHLFSIHAGKGTSLGSTCYDLHDLPGELRVSLRRSRKGEGS